MIGPLAGQHWNPGFNNATIQIYQPGTGGAADTILVSRPASLEIRGFTINVTNLPTPGLGEIISNQNITIANGTTYYYPVVGGTRWFGIHNQVNIASGTRTNWELSAWSSVGLGGALTTNADDSTTFNMIAENIVVQAQWARPPLTINSFVDVNGTVSAYNMNPAPTPVLWGNEVTLSVAPRPGYSLVEWVITPDESAAPHSATTPRTFVTTPRAPGATHYTATFTAIGDINREVMVTAVFVRASIDFDLPGIIPNNVHLGTVTLPFVWDAPGRIQPATVVNTSVDSNNNPIGINPLTFVLPLGTSSMFRFTDADPILNPPHQLTTSRSLTAAGADSSYTIQVRPRGNNVPLGSHEETVRVYSGPVDNANFLGSFTVTFNVVDALSHLQINNYPLVRPYEVFTPAQTASGDRPALDAYTVVPGGRPGYTFTGWTNADGSPVTLPNWTVAADGSATFNMPATNVVLLANWVDNGERFSVTIQNRTFAPGATVPTTTSADWTYEAGLLSPRPTGQTLIFRPGELVAISDRVTMLFLYDQVSLFTPGGVAGNISTTHTPNMRQHYYEIDDQSPIMPLFSNDRPWYFFRMPAGNVTVAFDWTYLPGDPDPAIDIEVGINNGDLGILPFGYSAAQVSNHQVTVTNTLPQTVTDLSVRLGGADPTAFVLANHTTFGTVPGNGSVTFNVRPAHVTGLGLTPRVYNAEIIIYRDDPVAGRIAAHPVTFDVRGFTIDLRNNPIVSATAPAPTNQDFTGTNSFDPGGGAPLQFGIHSVISLEAGERDGFEFFNWSNNRQLNIQPVDDESAGFQMSNAQFGAFINNDNREVQVTANWNREGGLEVIIQNNPNIAPWENLLTIPSQTVSGMTHEAFDTVEVNPGNRPGFDFAG